MDLSRAIIIAATLIAGAILARTAWTQATTTLFATAWVVVACGTPPATTGSASGWSYAAGGQAPLTMKTTGELCVRTTP